MINEIWKILSKHDINQLRQMQDKINWIERWTIKGENFDEMEEFKVKVQEQIDKLLNK